MDFLIAVGAKITEYAVAPVARQLSYLCHYKAHVDNLKTQIQHLEGAKIRLQHSIDEAERNDEEIEADVQNWLTRVTRILEEAKDLLEREDHGKCMSSGNFFLIPVSRHRLSKKAKTMTDEGASEIHLANTFQKISHRVPPQGVIDYVRGYATFQSRISTFNGIMEALRNPNVRIIGVSGMGGVGKTMLAKQVSRQAIEEEKLFNKVIMTTVSQTQDLKKIQKEIAEQLGLKLEEESIQLRAERLRRRVAREKKILLILDDIWEKLELHEVGISFGNDQNDCKILLTSRSPDVVCNDMGADKNFMIEDLYDKEAKHLFDKIVGDSVRNPDIQPLATEIVRECGGLPIAIVTVANALKNKSHPTWENALQELRRSVPTNVKGMHEKVYSSIKLSYNFLQSEEAKLLLLAFSLFPEDMTIEMQVVLRFGMGLGLFQGMTKLEEARNKVITLVENLETSSLLLDNDSQDTLSLHDVVHDFVIFTASKERQMYMFRNFAELEENEEVKGATAISLPNIYDHSQIPERLECPQLKLFFMHNLFARKHPDFQISNQFFEEMKELRVLELSFLCLKQLPSSFCCLQNLQSLLLLHCELGDVALIGELQALKILQICNSKIEELPKQIGQLTRLQLLDLSYCPKLEVIERDVISSLIHLEELRMVESFTKWDVDRGDCARRNASLIELKNLSRLTTLYFHIPDINILPKDLFSEKLKNYRILIGSGPGEWYKRLNRISSSRVLGLELNISRLLNDHGLKTLLKGSEVLHLYSPRGVNNGGIYGLDREGFPQLKNLIIVNNDEMQYIINSRKQNHPCNVFPSLESLYLKKLMYLEKIFHGKISTNSFGKLRVVRVKDCDRLKNLFPFSIAKKLREIEVINCKMMKEIVTYGREDDPHINATEGIAKIEFPQLQHLTVESSSELMHFFHSELAISCTGEMNQELIDVNGPIPLFNKTVAFPSLKFLALSTPNSEKLWPDQPPETFTMKKLTTLKVYGCKCLKYLLSFDMARSLVQLEYLKVSDCSVMEEVLATKDAREIYPCSPFVSLKWLLLKDLEKLERICHGKLTAMCFGKLRVLEVRNCNRLKSVFSLSEAKFLVQLKYIKVAECNMMEEIFVIEDDNQNSNNEVADKIEFPQLRSLNIRYLPKFVQVLTQVKMNVTHQRRVEQSVSDFAMPYFNEKVKFPKLKILEVKGMIGLNTIWNCQYEGLVEDAEEDAGILCRLERLRLEELPQLMHLWEEDYDPGKAFQNLKTLAVNSCNRLKNLVPSSISFQNMRTLHISKCHGMEHLLTSSTAKSLTRLKAIFISECERMIQIMADCKGGDDQTESDEIVFNRLEVLELDRLPSLTIFYSGNYVLRFPNLKVFILNLCPQMQSFCKGDISTPKLEKLILEDVDEEEEEEEDVDEDVDEDEEEDDDEDEDDDDTSWNFIEDIFKDRKMQQLIEGDVNATIRQISGSD